ncbi:MAG: hypothetical protein SGILL_002287 [Bacillariaceae sp.]
MDIDSTDPEIKLTVNKKYATEYQTRKEREELRQIQQRQRSDDDDDASVSSSSSDEDETAALLTPSVNVQFLKTINALRRKEQSIYDPNQRFFDAPMTTRDAHSGDSDDQGKQRRPKKYKDVIREQILEQMDQSDGDDDEDDDDDDKGVDDYDGDDYTKFHSSKRSKLAYDQQQDELRRAFLNESAKVDEREGDDGDISGGTGTDEEKRGDEWMVVKQRNTSVMKTKAAKEKAMEREAWQEIQELEGQAGNATPTFPDPRGEVANGEQFLFDFLKNKKWIDQNNVESGDDNGDDSDSKEDDSSLEDIDKADEFESKYNFRFEQAAAETGASGALLSVKTYARGQTMNTLRRDDTTRKDKRHARKERKVLERKEKEEQLKRLKNAKRKELHEKLSQVKAVIGAAEDEAAIDEAAIMKMLEGDFDPDKFEEAMQDAYGDDFYQKEDAEWKSDLDVRRTLQEDEDGDALVGKEDVDGGMYDEDDEIDDVQGDDRDYQDDEEWKDEDFYDPSQHPETPLETKLKLKMQDELYKLDYEDIVAGMPTRFKYRTVEPNDYGLTTQEILFARDSTLKQFVSLKKMAPYNEQGEFQVGGKKRRKFREQLKHDLEEEVDRDSAQNTQLAEHTNAEVEHPKKRKARRLKKGKKKENGDSIPYQAPDQAPTESRSGGNEHDVASTSIQKKRSRKKRGKKANDRGDLVHDVAEITQEALMEGRDGTDGQELSASHQPDSLLSADRKKKRKKSKKRKLVSGITSSRLASYGL